MPLDSRHAAAPAAADMQPAEQAATPVVAPAAAPEASRQRWFWTTKEEATLRALYPAVGAEGALAALPGRTLRSVYARAQAMRLKRRPAGETGAPRLRWTATPEIDALLRAEIPTCIARGSIDELAQRLGRPRWWVSRRGAKLGLAYPQRRSVEWTTGEEAILSEHCHLGLEALLGRLKRAGYSRSLIAIGVHLKRMKLSRIDPDVYSATELSELMGVDPATVRRWISLEGLPATRNPNSEAATPQWRITRKALRGWMRTHASCVDLRKVDRFWFLDVCLNTGSDRS